LAFPNVLHLFDWWLNGGMSLSLESIHQYALQNWSETDWKLDRAPWMGMEFVDDMRFDEAGKVRKESSQATGWTKPLRCTVQ
jgi:hypothetical protein